MAMKNTTRYAILGILSLSPGSGYDIKKYCDTVIANVWHENYGHIYPVLSTLLSAGFIMAQDTTGDSRKKVYEITDAGREEFLNWLREPAHYAPVRSEFMLKFLFSNTLPRENLLQMIAAYKTRHEDSYTSLMETEKEMNESNQDISLDRKRYLKATLRYGILNSRAAIEWCDEVIELFTTESGQGEMMLEQESRY